MATSEKTTIYLEPEIKMRLQQHAARHRQTLSGAANTLLIAALDREDSTRHTQPLLPKPGGDT